MDQKNSADNKDQINKRNPRFKIYCACLVFVALIACLISTLIFVASGYFQHLSCKLVLKDSFIWKNVNCNQLEVTKQEGNGEYKYEVIERNDLPQGSTMEDVVTSVVDERSKAVVGIGYFGNGESADTVIGSGFIITKNGLIVTNQHVVSDESLDYYVLLKDQTDPIEVTTIYRDAASDISIIKINKDNLPTIPLGDSDKLRVGQTVIAIGNPLGNLGTVTSGIISGLNRDVRVGQGYSTANSTFDGVIQTDAAINPGNSGGPLLNSKGEVIGINFATVSGADNLSFAIPINRVKVRIDELNKYGKFRIPYAGVEYRQRLVFFNNKPIYGAVVSRIINNSPAQNAGLKVGDIIVQFDGKNLEENSLYNLIQKSQIDQEIEIVIIRGKEQQTLKIKIGERP